MTAPRESSHQPSLSVIVPVYDGERFLAEALHSIYQQNYQPLEILVVDDGSTDRSADIATGFPGVCVLRKAHSGVAATLNLGVRQANGEYLAFLDADDRWLPDKLTRQISELRHQPDLDMVFGQARQFTLRRGANEDEEVFSRPQPAIHKSALLIRSASFWRVGEFPEQLDRHDFLDWYAKAMAVALQATILPEVLIERRIHDGNLGRTEPAAQRRSYLSTLRAAVQQRRRSSANEPSAQSMSQPDTPILGSTCHQAASPPDIPAEPGWTSYVAALRTVSKQAGHAQTFSTHRLCVAGVNFDLHIAGHRLVSAMMPALDHLRVTASLGDVSGPAITFDLWDTASTSIWPPRPPFAPDDYRRYGQRAIAFDGVRSLMHAPASGQIFAYDRSSRHGYFWTEDAGRLSIYERAAPVQTLFHWALAEIGWQIVHAAAIGNASGGVLLIGSTGAGKSTTALSCLAQEGLRFLSDDKCLVRLAPEPQAFALFSSAKIKADMLERLPHFRPLLSGWDGSYKANKGLVFLHPTCADHMVTTFPVKALLLPRVAHRTEAAIHPAAPGDVFRQLGPSTVIWLPGAEADNYRFTAALTRRLPCYRIELASDTQLNVDAIRRLLQEL